MLDHKSVSWRCFRLAKRALAVTMLAAIPLGWVEIAYGGVQVRGTAKAVRLEVTDAPVSEVLSALGTAFAVRYRAEIPLDREIDGTFRGSLNYVISRVLNGHSYVVKHDGTMMEILVIGVWQAPASASSYEDDEPRQRRRRRRSRY